jgi:hypothetical protein
LRLIDGNWGSPPITNHINAAVNCEGVIQVHLASVVCGNERYVVSPVDSRYHRCQCWRSGCRGRRGAVLDGYLGYWSRDYANG